MYHTKQTRQAIWHDIHIVNFTPRPCKKFNTHYWAISIPWWRQPNIEMSWIRTSLIWCEYSRMTNKQQNVIGPSTWWLPYRFVGWEFTVFLSCHTCSTCESGNHEFLFAVNDPQWHCIPMSLHFRRSLQASAQRSSPCCSLEASMGKTYSQWEWSLQIQSQS